LTLHLFAALAEKERAMIAARTKARSSCRGIAIATGMRVVRNSVRISDVHRPFADYVATFAVGDEFAEAELAAVRDSEGQSHGREKRISWR
jgi:hypothetical protein